MEESTLFEIIAVLLYKLGNRRITLTEKDLHEALEAYGADRIILRGSNGEMHVGMYNEENDPGDADDMQAFH